MNYVEIYKTVLNFHRRYSNITDTDEFWNALVNESGKIAKKYDNAKFVRDLLLAVVNEIERKAKELRNIEKTQ